jgi:hypothetical protein
MQTHSYDLPPQERDSEAQDEAKAEKHERIKEQKCEAHDERMREQEQDKRQGDGC